MLIAREWNMLRDSLISGYIPSFRTKQEARKAARPNGFLCEHVHQVDVGGIYGRVWIVGQKHLQTRSISGIEFEEMTCLSTNGSTIVRRDKIRADRLRFAAAAR